MITFQLLWPWTPNSFSRHCTFTWPPLFSSTFLSPFSWQNHLRHHTQCQNLISHTLAFFFMNTSLIAFPATISPSTCLLIRCVKSVQKYGVFSGPYIPVFGPEKTPYLDTFHAVIVQGSLICGKRPLLTTFHPL